MYASVGPSVCMCTCAWEGKRAYTKGQPGRSADSRKEKDGTAPGLEQPSVSSPRRQLTAPCAFSMDHAAAKAVGLAGEEGTNLT